MNLLDLSIFLQIDPRVLQAIGIGLLVLLSIFFLFVFWHIFLMFWLPARREKYVSSVSYVLLAIDIPKENEQSPKAVEHIFTTLSGAYSGPIKSEYYIDGKVQLGFSFEIVSLDGYIQYLVRVPVFFRQMVEAAFFSQYPDAQITEVFDYVDSVPQTFPNETHEMWGTELTLLKDDVYPIRTYQQFEHQMSQEFKDPMAALLEQLSRFQKGEQGWLQIVITPVIPREWAARGQKIIKKLIGEKVEYKKTFVDRLTDPILGLFSWMADTLIYKPEPQSSSGGDQPINKLQYLTAGEQLTVGAIQMKLSKVAFQTKIRYVYIAEKPIFSKPRGVAGVMGALSQFSSSDLNTLIPGDKKYKTSAYYVNIEKRLAKKQNRLFKVYKERRGVLSEIEPFMMNIEELATLYHFPDITVKTPLIKKADAKRAEPPVSLPFESLEETEVASSFSEVGAPPQNSSLEQLADVDLDNDYFENQFAKSASVSQSHPIKQASTQESKQAPSNLPT